MRNQFAKYVLVVGAVLLLQGCKPELTAEVYIGDILEAVDTRKPVEVPVIVGVPIDNAKKCDEAKRKMLPIIKPYALDLEFRECRKLSGELHDMMLLEMKMQVAVADKDTGNINWKGLFAIYVNEASFNNPDMLRLYILISNNLSKMEQQLDDAFQFQTVKIDDADITLVINNDTRTEVEVRLDSARINGKPYGQSHPFKLGRRDKLKIQPSNVSTQALLRDGWAAIGFVMNGNKPLPGGFRDVNVLGGMTKWEEN